MHLGQRFALSVVLLALGPAAARAAVELQPVVGGLSLPVAITHAGDGSGRLFITEQAGAVRIFDGTSLLPTPFLDLGPILSCCGERGLLSVAFHSSYAANGFFYVQYTDGQGSVVVARYRVSSNPNVANPSSGVVLLVVPQPFGNHNGGQLQFGPDGYLYVSLGDGGNAGDPFGHGQNLSTLLGTLLRIDVDGALPYEVPPDNPFVGIPGARDEIWVYGLRNPWRFSFDRLTGDLFLGDVGQGALEEIDFQPASSPGGENYGWNRMEGTQCFNPSSGCNDGSLTLPIVEYPHSLGCSVTGGYVYRGATLPELSGKYVYGDFCSGRIWTATEGPPGTWSAQEILQAPFPISTFGEDEAGEIYVAAYGGVGGTIYRIHRPVTVGFALAGTTVSESAPSVGVTVRVLTSSGAALAAPVSVDVASENGTALAGSDFTTVAETVSFPAGTPSGATRVVSVGLLDDALDEASESFTLRLAPPSGAAFQPPSVHTVTLTDDDPPPTLGIDDDSLIEGDCTTSDAAFAVYLSAPSGRTVTVDFGTSDGTATADADYTPIAGLLSFKPGDTSKTLLVPVRGDLKDESDETFTLDLANPVHAILSTSQATATIFDDDTGTFLSTTELTHGAAQAHDLAPLPGPAPDEDWFRIGQSPFASYEVVVDDLSSDVGEPPAGLSLERYSCGAVSVLQQGTSIGVGTARTLRWENASAQSVLEQLIRVRPSACGTDCGSDDTYRIRALETTYTASRFNNSGTQVTVLIVQNRAPYAISGHVWLWSAAGALAGSQVFTLSPRGSFVLNTSGLAPGIAGSLTVTHDGAYGDLGGKAVSLEAATGFSFDSPLLPRPH